MPRRSAQDRHDALDLQATRAARRGREDAREDLIRATEHVLGAVGPQAATVRAISSIAGTNTSAINYYFQSRENLLAEVGRRRMDGHNVVISERLERLRRSGAEMRVEDIFRPLVETAFNIWAADPVLRALRTMTIVEPATVDHFAQTQVNQIYSRMLEYLMIACPHLPADEIEWRFRLALGSIVHTVMVGQDAQKSAPVLGKEVTVDRMISFVSAPFKIAESDR